MPEDTQDGSRKIKWGMVKAAAACGDWLDVRMKDVWSVALGSAWAAPAETGRGLGGCSPRDTRGVPGR